MADHFLPSTLVTVLSRFHSYKSRCGATRGPIAVRLLASCISNQCRNLASMTFVGEQSTKAQIEILSIQSGRPQLSGSLPARDTTTHFLPTRALKKGAFYG